MEEKVIKPVIPEGYEVDEFNSTFELIKLKPINKDYPNSWAEAFVGNRIRGCFLEGNGDLNFRIAPNATILDRSVFKTERQALSAIAYAQISQLMALPCYNGDWVPDWSDERFKYTIIREGDKMAKGIASHSYEKLAFKSPERRDIFFDKYQKLLLQYAELK